MNKDFRFVENRQILGTPSARLRLLRWLREIF